MSLENSLREHLAQATATLVPAAPDLDGLRAAARRRTRRARSLAVSLAVLAIAVGGVGLGLGVNGGGRARVSVTASTPPQTSSAPYPGPFASAPDAINSQQWQALSNAGDAPVTKVFGPRTGGGSSTLGLLHVPATGLRLELWCDGPGRVAVSPGISANCGGEIGTSTFPSGYAHSDVEVRVVADPRTRWAIAFGSAAFPPGPDQPVSSASPSPLAAADPPGWTITPSSYGPIRVGMSIGAAQHLLGGATQLTPDGVEGGAGGSCLNYQSPRLPGLSVISEAHTVRAFFVDPTFGATADVRTTSGVRLGMTETDLVHALGPLAWKTASPLSAPDIEYSVSDTADNGALVVIVAKGVVVSFAAGDRNWAFPAEEGCF